MKSNVLQTLLVAFILIAGWTIFTIYQDLSSKPGGLNRTTVMNHGRQYLPTVGRSNSQSISGNLPVYKPSAGAYKNTQNRYAQRGSSGSLFSSSAFDISQTPAAGGSGAMMEPAMPGSVGRGSSYNSSSSSVYPSITFQPFSRRANGGLTALLEKSSQEQAPGGTAMASGFNETRYKAFGNPGDDDFEEGGGTENPGAYNDVPVGEGVFILVILILLYAIFLNKKEKIIHNDHQ
jgi:hypothetical protein